MKSHTMRTVIIYAVLLFSLIYIYPTMGWMLLSDDQRQARLEQWKQEDRVFSKPNDFAKAVKSVKRWAQFDRSKVINLGLDLQGGIHMVLGLDMNSVDPKKMQEYRDMGLTDAQITKEFQTMALRTIERRVNEFEAKEPTIQLYGDRQIQIQLPGEKDVDRAKRLIMKVAQLTFHLVVLPEETDRVFAAIERRFPKQFLPYLRPSEQGGPYEIDTQHFDVVHQVIQDAENVPDLIPDDKMVGFSKKPDPFGDSPRYKIYLLDKKPLMSGEGLKQALGRQDPNSLQGFWHILFRLDPTSGRRFGEITEKYLMRNMAIVVDNVVESAPRIQSKITTDGEISGMFSAEEAKDLAIALNSGSMPARVVEDFTGVVGASLGADSVRKGVISSIIGLILVVVFMGIYYRIPGMIANVAQVYNAIFLLAAMAYFGCTLTLPGIAGLVLTIGMAVDSNVLIYERIREEIRNGRSMLASIDNGFGRAQVTILDSNITTLIAAAVMLQFGTGAIQGFAITLSIGILTTIFVALVVCRGMFDFLAKKKLLGNLHMMELIPSEPKIRFLAQRFIMISITVGITIVGLFWFGVRIAKGDMFGVDFVTGTNMVVNLRGETPIDIASVRGKLTEAGFREPIVQEYGQGTSETRNRFLIRIHRTGQQVAAGADSAEQETADKTVSGRVQATLASLFSSGDTKQVEIERLETVGPAVGKQLMRDGILSVLYSFVFMIVYLWFRFQLKFGIGGIVALFHDVFITLGIFAIIGRQVTMPLVAALLTIIGYSINDTIVVFDRLREVIREHRGRDISMLKLMDISVNQTLSRSLITSFTVFVVVVVLYIFGGEVLNDMALALIIGTVVGSYSTIYIASPIAYYVEVIQEKRTRRGGEADEQSSPRRRKAKRATVAEEEEEATA